MGSKLEIFAKKNKIKYFYFLDDFSAFNTLFINHLIFLKNNFLRYKKDFTENKI